jgi:hypothetical protein
MPLLSLYFKEANLDIRVLATTFSELTNCSSTALKKLMAVLESGMESLIFLEIWLCMSKRLRRLDRSYLSYNFFSSGVLDSVGIGGISSQSTRSISMHPNVKIILSFHSEKLEPFNIGIRDADWDKRVGSKAAKIIITYLKLIHML